jgi:hypothetical protein
MIVSDVAWNWKSPGPRQATPQVSRGVRHTRKELLKIRLEVTRQRKITPWGVLVTCLVALFALGAGSQANSLEDLLQRWEARDGAAFIEVGHELSEHFVLHPRQFMKLMADNPESWRSWLERLPVHTLTVFREGGLTECEQLRSRMIESAESLVSDPTLSDRAGELLTVLKSTTVREIN